MRGEIVLNYKYGIQEPVHEHRQETAKIFKNQNDYIDMNAYNVGKIELSKSCCDHSVNQSS